MWYKCLDCGHIFEEGEEKKWQECVGEFWGTPTYQTYSGCPLCRGDFEETIPCDICGSEHLENELIGGVCEECIEECRYDINTCYEIGKNDDEPIKINLFLATLFDKEEIEEILLNVLLQREKILGKVDCLKFINADKSWFAEILAEEVKKNEKAKG